MDSFDDLLISRCSILRRTAGVDAYNNQLTDRAPVATDVPCRLSQTAMFSRSNETKAEKSVAVKHATIFMRPYAGLTEHDWLLLDDKQWNIIAINNPSGADHHWEVAVELVAP
jgi:hypothetical protein